MAVNTAPGMLAAKPQKDCPIYHGICQNCFFNREGKCQWFNMKKERK